MSRLSDLQFANLIDEIACAMHSRAPVDQAMRRLADRRLGRVGRVAKRIAEKLDQGRSLEDAVGDISSPVTSQVCVAISAVEHGGDVKLLSRLAEQLRRRSQYIGGRRVAYFYPLLLLVIAYIATVTVAIPLVLQNQGRDFQWTPWLVSLLGWLQDNVWMPPLVFIVAAILAWLAMRSRNRMPRHSRISLFLYSLADQIRGNVPEDQAIRSAAHLSGDRRLMSIEDPTLQSPAIARLISQGFNPLEDERDQAEGNTAAERGDDQLPSPTGLANQPSILVARLYYLAADHAEAARRDAYLWSRLVPRAAMILVGCCFVFAYAWFIIAPVYRQVAQW